MHLSVLDLIYQRAGMTRSNPAVSVFRDGSWVHFDFEDLQRMAQHLSNYLIDSGIRRGDRIAVLSESSPEYGIVFFAAIRAGAILVPLEPRASIDELEAQLIDSTPRVLFASQAGIDFADSMAKKLSFDIRIICTEEFQTPPNQKTLHGVSTHILREGCERQMDEPALIIYTAGATGEPKGVTLTFGNLFSQAERLQALFDVGRKDRFLSTVSMSNVTELTLGYLGALFAGAEVRYLPNSNRKAKLKSLNRAGISYVVTTTPFLLSFKDVIEKRLAKSSLQRRLRFKMRFGLAKLLPRRSRRKLFPLLDEIVGAQFKSFVSVGAPLPAHVESFLDTVGIDVCQGYGLAEASGLISLNSQENFRLHSAGKPLPELELRLIGSKGIGDEGEIVVRGPNIMHGYYNQAEKTSIAVDSSGWLYTGDLGAFDEDGFLYIRGRIRDLIHLDGGKRFYPQEIEALVAQSALVKEVCLLGLRDSGSFHHKTVVAVVVPEKKNQSIKSLRKDIDTFLESVPAFKVPARIIVSTSPLPRTTSGEIKRNQVLEWLQSYESANS